MTLSHSDRKFLAEHIGSIVAAALGPWDESQTSIKPDDELYIVEALPFCARRLARTDPMWLARFAQCGLDLLTDTLDPDRWPEPRCTGEEVIIAMAERNMNPTATDDIERFKDIREMLCQDLDVEWLFAPESDGIENDEEFAAQHRVANLKPADWFRWFGNVEPRCDRSFPDER